MKSRISGLNGKSDFPGFKRQDAASFSINGKGYLGSGLSGLNIPTRDFWKYDPLTAGNIVTWKTTPARGAVTHPFPDDLPVPLRTALSSLGISSLYSHQTQAWTYTRDGKNVVLYIWYDNEFGYSHQVIRLAKYISKVRRYTYY